METAVSALALTRLGTGVGRARAANALSVPSIQYPLMYQNHPRPVIIRSARSASPPATSQSNPALKLSCSRSNMASVSSEIAR